MQLQIFKGLFHKFYWFHSGYFVLRIAHPKTFLTFKLKLRISNIVIILIVLLDFDRNIPLKLEMTMQLKVSRTSGLSEVILHTLST